MKEQITSALFYLTNYAHHIMRNAEEGQNITGSAAFHELAIRTFGFLDGKYNEPLHGLDFDDYEALNKAVLDAAMDFASNKEYFKKWS